MKSGKRRIGFGGRGFKRHFLVKKREPGGKEEGGAGERSGLKLRKGKELWRKKLLRTLQRGKKK